MFAESSHNDFICNFNKYGYCKFSDKCRYRHVNEFCIDIDCIASTCWQRHPRSCDYFRKYNYCKFGQFCAYSHESNNDECDVRHDLTEMKVELEAFSIEMKEKSEEVMKLKTRILELEVENEN